LILLSLDQGGPLISIPAKKFRVNRWIRTPKLRVVADDGTPLGILTLEEALKAAEEKGLDLVEVAPKEVPPVAKIMDYGKFKYTMEKRNRDARKKQKAFTLKEVKMRPKIGDHDFDTKRNHALDFLKGGHKVKVTCSFFGREMSHQELGRVLIDKMIKEIGDLGKVEMPAKMEGRNLSVIIGPSPKALKEMAAHEKLHEKKDKHDDKAKKAHDAEKATPHEADDDDIEDDESDDTASADETAEMDEANQGE
jgi:translation initiation factor IF-3